MLRAGPGSCRWALPVALGVCAAVAGLGCAAIESGQGGASPLNATYRVEGQPVRLIGGFAEEFGAPGSATRARTFVFGEPAYGDLDGDGIEDAAVFLVRDPGGSGTFCYVAAALRVGATYRGTNAVLLGDRVAPQEVVVRNGVVSANYLVRRPGEAMAAVATVRATLHLAVQAGELVAVPTAGPVR